MNRLQKELSKLSLEQEKKLINELKKQIEEALKDVNAKIAHLQARYERQGLQSIIYQLKYQTALKAQISAILDNLRVNQYTSIMDYLRNCYEDGYIGVLYDLHAQGVPLVFPIDQEKMVRAIMTDSKIKGDLYKSLGMDVNQLKKEIRQEISRGISSNMSFNQIASLIKIRGDVYLNKAYRIARTEGHRIQEASKYDAQLGAKAEGADIVKQWDATLDKRTRRAHGQIDGQTREIDEPFTYTDLKGTHKAMFPGGFGVASLDINCRCTMIQRARWAIDEEEIITKTLEGKIVNIKAKDYQGFKNQYFKLTERK